MNRYSSKISAALGSVSERFVEAVCETLVVLAMAVAISIGVISLATHLNETRMVGATASIVDARMAPPFVALD